MRFWSLFLVFVFLMFLSGCSSQSSFNVFNPYTGSDALVVSLMPSAPPEITYSGIPYKIGFKLTNYGALDIHNAYIVVGTDDFGGAKISNPSASFDLKGKKSTHFFRGETTYKFFDAVAPKLTSSQQVTNILLTYLVCYPYETKSQISLCIDTNPYNPSSGGCRFSPSVDVAPAGGPVNVVNVKESPVPLSSDTIKLRFVITVKNLGNGLVLSYDNYKSLCDGSVDYKNLGKVKVSASLSGSPLECYPSSISLMPSSANPETAVFTCYSSPMKMRSSFTSLLTVDLKYGYFLSGSKKLQVYKLS